MRPADLFTICLDRTYYMLTEGVWDSCIANPFSSLPSSIVENLVELTETIDRKNPPKLDHVTLLLKSGRIRRLDIEFLDIRLSWLANTNNLISQIISWNPHLEEVYLHDPKNIKFFQNHETVRILRFSKLERFDGISITQEFVQPYLGSVLPSLSNLTVLRIRHMDTDTKVKILDTCPKIISLGPVDTLDAMEEITRRSLSGSLSNIEHGSHLQLRRCCWGDETNLWSFKPSPGREMFPYQVKYAVSLCPLLKELIFFPNHTGVIRELRNIKKLSLLKIYLRFCDDNCVPEFIELLQIIGLQLKHLSVTCAYPIPIDSICECCPHLESFEIRAPLFVENSRKTSSDLCLKRIRFNTIESAGYKESIEFLLPKCKHLEKLYLANIPFLDDEMLVKILKINPFAKLTWIYIKDSNLTQKGYDMLVSSPESIGTITIDSGKIRCFYFNKNVLADPNVKFVRNELKYIGFIPQLNRNRF